MRAREHSPPRRGGECSSQTKTSEFQTESLPNREAVAAICAGLGCGDGCRLLPIFSRSESCNRRFTASKEQYAGDQGVCCSGWICFFNFLSRFEPRGSSGANDLRDFDFWKQPVSM